jgi:hypothetical protein
MLGAMKQKLSSVGRELKMAIRVGFRRHYSALFHRDSRASDGKAQCVHHDAAKLLIIEGHANDLENAVGRDLDR